MQKFLAHHQPWRVTRLVGDRNRPYVPCSITCQCANAIWRWAISGIKPQSSLARPRLRSDPKDGPVTGHGGVPIRQPILTYGRSSKDRRGKPQPPPRTWASSFEVQNPKRRNAQPETPWSPPRLAAAPGFAGAALAILPSFLSKCLLSSSHSRRRATDRKSSRPLPYRGACFRAFWAFNALFDVIDRPSGRI